MQITITGHTALTTSELEEFVEHLNGFFNDDFHTTVKDNRIIFSNN